MSSSPAEKPKFESTANPNWVDLPKDITSNILQRLNAIEILTKTRYVCPYWWNMCKDPFMWREISLDRSLFDLWPPNLLDLLVELCQYAVDLSSGHLEKIDIYCFGTDDLLQYIADRASNLRCIRLDSCDRLSYEGWCDVAKKFPLLEEIYISECLELHISLDVIGQSCPLLKSLSIYGMFDAGRLSCDDEAFIIAKTMPGLLHLVLHGDPLRNVGLLAILDGCPRLESLDILGWISTDFDGSLWKRLHTQIKDLHIEKIIHEAMDLTPFRDILFMNKMPSFSFSFTE